MTSRDFTNRDVLLDSNLLVVLIIGLVQPLLLGTGRVSQYDLSDLRLLKLIANKSRKLITTPFVIAEVNSLLQMNSSHYVRRCRAMLGELLVRFEEQHIPSHRLLTSEPRLANEFGVTDMSILEVAKRGTIILTEDRPLAALLRNKGLEVLDLDTLRIPSK